MPTYRVTVWNTENPGHQRLHFLEGASLERSHVETLCRELLCDPVTEQFGIDSSSSAASFFEVTFLPGVTDSAAENLVRAATLLDVPLEEAATGERLEYADSLSLETLDALAHERINEVIQRFSLNAPITPPFVHHPDS
jgi:hypothetical protein